MSTHHVRGTIPVASDPFHPGQRGPLVVFVIVAFAIFLVVKAINRLRRAEEGAAPEEPVSKKCPRCLSDIPVKADRCAFCTADLAV